MLLPPSRREQGSDRTARRHGDGPVTELPRAVCRATPDGTSGDGRPVLRVGGSPLIGRAVLISTVAGALELL